MSTACPHCGTLNAYIGFTTVECVNDECPNYSRKQEKHIFPWRARFENDDQLPKDSEEIE